MASVPAIPNNLCEIPIPGGLVLTRSDWDGFYLLNPSATILWNLLTLTNSWSELVRDYSQAFQISPVIAEKDILTALHEWQEGPLRPATPGLVKPRPDQHLLAPNEPPLHIQSCQIGKRSFQLRYFAEDLFTELSPRLKPVEANNMNAGTKINVFWQGEYALAMTDDGQQLAAETNEHATRAILLQELVRMSEGIDADWLTVLHAGACTNGKNSILFPAATCSGKSTLMAALMQAGYAVLADDSTPITRATHLPVKMPFAMMIREGSWPFLESLGGPETFGTARSSIRNSTKVRFLPLSSKSRAAEPLPIAALVFPRYEQQATLNLQRIDCWTVLQNLHASGLWVSRSGTAWAEFLSLLQTVPAYTLSYNDGYEAIRVVEAIFAEPDGRTAC